MSIATTRAGTLRLRPSLTCTTPLLHHSPDAAATHYHSASLALKMTTTTPVPSTKRKRTVADLETIELDPHYDLTLIVGTPNHKDGQKAFRVNKGSMRNMSDVWSKMLTCEWAESKMTEIDFPDDSCKSFQIVLEVAHFRVAGLPDALTSRSYLS